MDTKTKFELVSCVHACMICQLRQFCIVVVCQSVEYYITPLLVWLLHAWSTAVSCIIHAAIDSDSKLIG